MIHVLLVDDDPLVRSGLRLMLAPESDIEIVGESANGEDAVAAVLELRPDVVLMDVRMPVLDGIEATRRIVAGDVETRVVVLTTFELDEYVFDAIRAGASGFLLKRTAPEEVVAGVRAAAAGDALLTPAVTRKLIGEFARLSESRREMAIDHLTEREAEVLRLLGRGLSNSEIAEELVIAESTAKTHVKRILSKLGLRDRAQAVIVAYETGLVVPRERNG